MRLFFWQVVGYKEVIKVDTDDSTDNRGKDRDQPISIREQALGAGEKAKQTGAKVTGRIDGIATGAAEAQTNRKDRTTNQEWAHIVHQAGIFRITAGQNTPQQNHRAEDFSDDGIRHAVAARGRPKSEAKRS